MSWSTWTVIWPIKSHNWDLFAGLDMFGFKVKNNSIINHSFLAMHREFVNYLAVSFDSKPWFKRTWVPRLYSLRWSIIDIVELPVIWTWVNLILKCGYIFLVSFYKILYGIFRCHLSSERNSLLIGWLAAVVNKILGSLLLLGNRGFFIEATQLFITSML